MTFALEEMVHVTNDELAFRLERLAAADRTLNVKLIVHLAEAQERELYLARGYSHLYGYCTGALRMSEAQAYARMKAASICRELPLVLERLSTGELTLTGIKLLAAKLTAANHVQLLDRVRGMSKRQIERVLAELAPKPDVPDSVRKLRQRRAKPAAEPLPLMHAAVQSNTASKTPTPGQQSASATSTSATSPASTSAASAASTSAASTASTSGASALASVAASSTAATASREPSAALTRAAAGSASTTFVLEPPRSRASTTPLSPGRFKLEVTLDQECHDDLEQLQELLRHSNPRGDIKSIIKRALKELREREMKRRFGQGSTPRPRATRMPTCPGTNAVTKTNVAPATSSVDEDRPQSEATSGAAAASRHVPVAVRRELFARDGGRCTFESVDGRRCPERGFLEVHHHSTTFARGGEATAANLRLVCRAHNRFFAEKDYGRKFVQAKVQAAIAQRSSSEANSGT